MGHNAIVGQSGGPTSVINSSLAGAYSVLRRCGVNTVYGMRHGVQGLLKEDLVVLNTVLSTPAAVELLKLTPAMLLGSCRYKLPDAAKEPAVYEALFAILAKYDIGLFLYIGGNDSMDTILKLSDYAAATGSDIRFVGVPKTIDNDLCVTDHTPGYGSAAKYIGTTVRELVRDSTIYDIRSATVVEIMGRNAGWLTAAAALAEDEDCEGAAMICLPEVAFDPEAFVAHVSALQTTSPSIVIAVSEGIRLADGRYVAELGDALSVDPFGHKNLTGAARYLCGLLAHRLGAKTRAIELSTLQRCAAHLSSLTDIEEAYRCGGAAAQAALDGQSGVMIALERVSDDPYLCATRPRDIHGIANLEKTVPLPWIDAQNYRIRPPFLDYALPLIRGEPSHAYVRGMPGHLTL